MDLQNLKKVRNVLLRLIWLEHTKNKMALIAMTRQGPPYGDD